MFALIARRWWATAYCQPQNRAVALSWLASESQQKMGQACSTEPNQTKVLPLDNNELMPDIMHTQFLPPSARRHAQISPQPCSHESALSSWLSFSPARGVCLAVNHVSKDNPWLPLLTPHQLVEINGAFRKFGARQQPGCHNKLPARRHRRRPSLLAQAHWS